MNCLATEDGRFRASLLTMADRQRQSAEAVARLERQRQAAEGVGLRLGGAHVAARPAVPLAALATLMRRRLGGDGDALGAEQHARA